MDGDFDKHYSSGHRMPKLTSGESTTRSGWRKLTSSSVGGRSTHICTNDEGEPSSRQLENDEISSLLHSGSQQQLMSQAPAVRSHRHSQSNLSH